MSKERFGQFLQGLRKVRTFTNEDFITQPWTQAHVAKEAGLPINVIAGIEQGRVAHLQPHLEKLAKAFQLNDQEKEVFYKLAGYFDTSSSEETSDEKIAQYLQEVQYVGLVYTQLWDLIGFNEYFRILFSYHQAQLPAINQGEIGPNLLALLFAQEELERNNNLENAQIIPQLTSMVKSFRISSFAHQSKFRFRQIDAEMKREYPLYAKISAWLDHEEPSSDTTLDIHHPQFGKISIVKVSPETTFKEDVQTSLWIPVSPQNTNYLELQNSVINNQAHLFDKRSLDKTKK